MHALSSGLPDAVHAPRGFVARRLRDKLPPLPVPGPTPTTAPAPTPDPSDPEPRLLGRLLPECTECGVPGRPAAFAGGLCRGCRTVVTPHGDAEDVAARKAPPVTAPRAATLAREAVLAARDRRQPAKFRPDAVFRP